LVEAPPAGPAAEQATMGCSSSSRGCPAAAATAVATGKTLLVVGVILTTPFPPCLAFFPLVFDLAVPFLERGTLHEAGSSWTLVQACATGGKSGWLKAASEAAAMEAGRNTASPGR